MYIFIHLLSAYTRTNDLYIDRYICAYVCAYVCGGAILIRQYIMISNMCQE